MPLLRRWLRSLQVPRPKRFLHFMSLRTGAEMISLTMIINKVTGFYGLLAILTGLKLSTLQLTMYLYSVGAMLLLAMLMPHIRKQTPFHCLALAWFYLLDTVINSAFTAAFTVTWFLAVSADSTNSGVPSSAPGSGMIDDAAGFTSPKYNVSEVEVIVKPADGATVGQDAVAYGTATATAAAGSPSLGHGVGVGESVPSLLVVVALTLVRVYFILVIMAFARQVLRQSVFTGTEERLHAPGRENQLAENPFAKGNAQGYGWKGNLGRLMVGLGETYWLGGPPDRVLIKSADGRFRTRRSGYPTRTRDGERRARSGRGLSRPPQPSIKVQNGMV